MASRQGLATQHPPQLIKVVVVVMMVVVMVMMVVVMVMMVMLMVMVKVMQKPNTNFNLSSWKCINFG